MQAFPWLAYLTAKRASAASSLDEDDEETHPRLSWLRKDTWKFFQRMEETFEELDGISLFVT